MTLNDENLIVAEVALGSSANNGNHLTIQVRRIPEGENAGLFFVRMFVNHRITTGPKRYRGKRTYTSHLTYRTTEENARSMARAAWRAAVANGTDTPMIRPALAAAHREARRLGLDKP